MSPALTIVEKVTSKALASLFGLDGAYAGGITCPGGSASNLTALVIARNTLFPETKQSGNENRRFVMFTSEDGHYSHEKAAQICGMGSFSCWPVPVDAEGRMKATDLQRMVTSAREQGLTPFYVNATAGTTVFGAYDPLVDIAKICKTEKLWFHGTSKTALISLQFQEPNSLGAARERCNGCIVDNFKEKYVSAHLTASSSNNGGNIY